MVEVKNILCLTGQNWAEVTDYLKENIDYAIVKPDVSQKEIEDFCALAIKNGVKVVDVPPVFVSLAVLRLRDKEVDVATTAGFPYGNIPAELKESGIAYAARQGARWVNVCLNISSVKSGRYREVEEEIMWLNKTANKNQIGLKLIVESPYLTEDELTRTARLVNSHKVEYLKTSTGVGVRVSERDISIIKPLLTNTKLKAAGGIATLEDALKFFELGADNIGSSRGFQILGEAKEHGIQAVGRHR